MLKTNPVRVARLAATPAMTDDSQLSFTPAIGFAQESHSRIRWRPAVLRQRRDAARAGRAPPRSRRNSRRATSPIRAIPAHITHTVADVLQSPHAGDRLRLSRRQRLQLAALRSGLQAGVRTAARHRRGPVLAADHLALGERADAAGDHPPHLRARRYLVQELHEAARVSGPGYRRHGRCRARPPEAGGMERPLR